MTVTPCSLCQLNVEVYQGEINQNFGSNFNMPVFYYSQLKSAAQGRSVRDAVLDGQIFKAKQLEEIAAK